MVTIGKHKLDKDTKKLINLDEDLPADGHVPPGVTMREIRPFHPLLPDPDRDDSYSSSPSSFVISPSSSVPLSSSMQSTIVSDDEEDEDWVRYLINFVYIQVTTPK